MYNIKLFLFDLALINIYVNNLFVFFVCPQVQRFFESIKEQASELRATQVALDNVQKNVRWIQRNLETLRKWLSDRVK